MSTTQQKVVVLKSQTRVESRVEAPNRDFWMTMRQSLLIQLSTLEKMLGITRRCKNCGHVQ